ncbi:hypothetical protein N0O92_09395 [Alkalihalobacillus sp. MEB130]|uniref:hypothetical protein n=1 Tax=Alkalihalobacillus sp. MEB130 TaxID=2976704 RepID=UPI0028DF5FD6|nr:hypothetical protein [Alkalihalobacillus sp. MEB130]MDT8860449.1 hypothetical protein [Alkalihalobacillus sp. MEB130]
MKNVNGVKGWVTPTCMLVSPVLMLLAHLFDVVGLISWGLLFILLFVAAYFTKYLPVPNK